MTTPAMTALPIEKEYEAFIRAKKALAPDQGITVLVEDVHPLLKPHQRDIVRWAVQGARRAIFTAFGLGKTLMQIEAVRLVIQRVGGRGLIVMPLGVRQEFIRDAEKVGVSVRFIRSIDETDAYGGIYLTNYETVRDGKLDPGLFTTVSLDEAGILRGFGGTKTFRELMATMAGDDRRDLSNPQKRDGIPYRFVATATPSPNEYIELLAYAAFLGIMEVDEAKTRFFKRNSEKADKLTLHPHKVTEFYTWLASWAIFLEKPSDLCRCVCHRESNSRVSGSDGSRSLNGHQTLSAMEHGSAGATAETRTLQGQTISSKVSSSVVDASGLSMEGRAREHTQPGKAASGDASIPMTRTGQTTEVEGLRSASGGDSSPTSSPTWESHPKAHPSTGSTTMGTTSLATAAGLPRSSRHETGEREHSTPTERGMQPGGSCEVCCCNEGYDLPPLTIQWHELPTDHGRAGVERNGQHRMFANASLGVTEAAREKRETISERVDKLMALLPEDGQQAVIWCDLNREQQAIERALDAQGITYSSLYGSQSIEAREDLMAAWRRGDTRIFLSKPVMYGSGVNLQQCSMMLFAGIGFKFALIIQAIHRIYRFLQQHPCQVHFIYTEAEREVRATLERKWQQHNELVAQMTAIIREYGLARASMEGLLHRAMDVQRQEATGRGWRLVNNDAVNETAQMEADSVDLILTSIPFSTQYEYSPSYRDFGHSDHSEHFWQQMDFLSPELLRVLRPGRNLVVHVKDRIAPGGITGFGFQTVQPFHAEAISHYICHGFAYLGMRTIVTDVVRENNQTYRLGWTEQCKDGSRMGCGMPEYLLIFRKPPTDPSNGYADVPVVKQKNGYSLARWQTDAAGYWRSSGDRLLAPEDLQGLPHNQVYKLWRKHNLETPYDYDQHVSLGDYLQQRRWLPVTFSLLPAHSWHPDVWTDVARMRSLNGAQWAKGKEMHLCPLQFDICERVITQMSMPGELVYDPFSGIGSVPYMAVKLGRQALGVELSAGYHADAIYWLKQAEQRASTPGLFDLAIIDGRAGCEDQERPA